VNLRRGKIHVVIFDSSGFQTNFGARPLPLPILPVVISTRARTPLTDSVERALVKTTTEKLPDARHYRNDSAIAFDWRHSPLNFAVDAANRTNAATPVRSNVLLNIERHNVAHYRR